MIYLDYAATTPMRAEAIAAYSEAAKHFYGNTSSLHDTGSKAGSLLEACRQELARLLNAESSGLFFTAGGSDSNLLALQSLLEAHRTKGKHLITTRMEHSSVRNFFKKKEQEGFEVTLLGTNEFGRISIDELEKAIRPDTILASIQHANSEIGTLQNIEEIGALLFKKGVVFHADCVQSFGKVPIDVKKAKIDSLSLSAHKIYGPKGTGAVYLNPRVKWSPLYPGTTHESGFKPGTLNVPGIAAFTAAAQLICEEMAAESLRLEELREHFKKELADETFEIMGPKKGRLPNIIGMRIKGIEGQYTMLECNRRGIAISTGSACQMGLQAPSAALLAIGLKAEEAKQFVRISMGKSTTQEEIDKTVDVLKEIVENF